MGLALIFLSFYENNQILTFPIPKKNNYDITFDMTATYLLCIFYWNIGLGANTSLRQRNESEVTCVKNKNKMA